MGRVKNDSWIGKGLRFECTECGRCCGGAPGFVWVTDKEIADLAGRLNLNDLEFRRRYTHQVRGYGTSLTETADFDCVFYDRESKGCGVYEQRPRQCRTYPFWGKVIASKVTWEMEAEECPGIHQGRIWPLTEIKPLAKNDGLNKPGS